MKIVTCIAPVNIAVIKYWGKRDENLILPVNDSISCTLSTDFMCAKTTILASPLLKENKFWLNGKEQSFDNERLNNCLKEVKRRANPSQTELLSWNISICSVNNFPTAAGLASSAAGYACLVFALSTLYELSGDISSIARRGSGSACRSVYGGWVQWYKGSLETGHDSIARQILPATHWPEIRILVLVVNDGRKKCGSTIAMKNGVETSEYLKYRAEHLVSKRIEAIKDAIQNKDFDKFAKITMQDSNQFHGICLDTFPPCVYMNDVSHSIVNMVHQYNDYHGVNKVAYTFDAGPNACLFLLDEDVEEFLSVVNYTFPPNIDLVEYIRGLPVNLSEIKEDLKQNLNLSPEKPGSLKYVICTCSGDGPKIITNPYEHLLTEAGLPKSLYVCLYVKWLIVRIIFFIFVRGL